jgi:hypothetical protein
MWVRGESNRNYLPLLSNSTFIGITKGLFALLHNKFTCAFTRKTTIALNVVTAFSREVQAQPTQAEEKQVDEFVNLNIPNHLIRVKNEIICLPDGLLWNLLL